VPTFRFAAFIVLAGQLLFARQPPNETDRLIAIGRLWVTVNYFHPYLAYRDIDWDQALVDSLPKMRGAGGSAEYAASIESMLDALHDPSTYAVVEGPQHEGGSLKIDKRPDGALIVSQSPASAQDADMADELIQAIRSSRNIVFDLRGGELLSILLDRPDIQATLTSVPFDTPGQRTWIHNGLASDFASRFYYSGFEAKPGIHITPDSQAAAHELVFILGENSHLPAIACALRAAGKATVRESLHYQVNGVETVAIPMGEGVAAVVRLSEPLPNNGSGLPPYPSPQPDRAYAASRYPSPEYRILAAYKVWAVFRYFFAYRDLMDEDWDDVFARFLPKFVDAKDAREYNLTVSEMVAQVADSHASVQSEELAEYFGKAPVGLRLRLIEKKPVITEILDDDAKKAGVQVGDIVSKVDGESIVDRFNRESPYVSSSTPQWHGYRIVERILNGPEGSMAALSVGGQDGRLREVSLKRSSSYAAALRNQRTGEVIKFLPGNIGYADLDRLNPDEVDSMFEKFRNAKAIVFDMRGYPHGTAWSIAPRLTDRKDVAAAIFTGPLSLTPDLPNGEALTSSASYFFVQRLPATDKWKYNGKTVMLIDERTIGQAEHMGLFFAAANKTEFIGTPSAGADGDVTNFVVPGGITIYFSGRDVRYANGGKLQQLGLQPAVSVAPTIKGIRGGRDEVLERALEYVTNGEIAETGSRTVAR